METFLDKLVESGCAEGNPVLNLVQELDWSSCDDADRPATAVGIHCSGPSVKSGCTGHGAGALAEPERPVDGVHMFSSMTEAGQAQGSDMGTSGLFDPLRTLFLAEPQFFDTHFRHCFEEKPMGLDGADTVNYSEGLLSRHLEHDSISHGDNDHGDDCTPTSGPDYLMEVQNPTWEMALHSRMHACLLTCLELRGASSSSTAVMEFCRFFNESVIDNPTIYERKSVLLEKTQSAFERGKELMAQNMTTEALSFLESAVEDNPEVTERWILLALCQYLLQDDASATSACIQFLKHSSSEDPARSLVHLLLATCLANEGDTAASSAVLFEWCIEMLGIMDDDVAKACCSTQSLSNHSFPHAKVRSTVVVNILSSHEVSAESATFDASLQWAKAISYFGLEDFAAALRCFEAVAAHSPESPSVLNQIAACHHNLKNLDSAIEFQDKALNLLPGFPRALYNRATTLFAMEQVEKALEVIESVLDQPAGINAGLTWDQFWCLAARIIPRLPAKEETQYKRRKQLMSAILTRSLKEFKGGLRAPH